MKKIIENFFNSEDFTEKDEIFLSESDFQINFARALKNNGCNDVTLEYPKTIDNKKCNVDIYCKYRNVNYYIELKYKTKAIQNKKYTRFGIDFFLKNHNAYPDDRYAVYKDIKRLEDLVSGKSKEKQVGYVLLLTNVSNYEKNHKDMPLCNITNKTCNHKRKQNFALNQQYKCEWQDFKKCGGFRYLLIEISANN